MPLFMCTNCGCVENTALSGYWSQESYWRAGVMRLPIGTSAPPFKPKCSQCDERIGAWHGQFPRKLAEGYVCDRRGQFIYTPEQASGSASHMGPFEPVKLPEGARV